MTITITEYGSNSMDDGVNTSVSSWTVSAASASQITLTSTYQGTALTATFQGAFSFSQPVTGLSLDTVLNGYGTGTVDSLSVSGGGVVEGTKTFSTPVSLELLRLADSSVLASDLLYNGQESFTTGSGATTGNHWYGYAGYATLYDNHLFSAGSTDTFFGGSGGINTLVLPGASTG